MSKKKEKETIFKNTVGRPTNEIKKKRKLLVFSIIFLILAVVSVGILVEYRYIMKKEDSAKLFAAAKSKHEISMQKFNDGTLPFHETKKFKVNVTNPDYVELSSSDPSVIQVIKYGDNTDRGNLWTLKPKTAGKATITAKAYRTINGKKKVYNTLKYKYVVKEHDFSYNYGVLAYGVTTEKFKVNLASPKDSVEVISSNPSVAQVLKYGNNSAANNKWAIKVKKAGTFRITIRVYKIVGGKKKIYNTQNESWVINEPKKTSLFCVSDENPSKKIDEIEVNKPFRCYTQNKAGIILTADKDGLAKGYDSSYKTVQNDYWIKLKYTTTGLKTIQAKSSTISDSIKIYVSDSKTNTPKLYCVKDSNTSVKVTSVKVNETFKCYTDAKAGIKLSASTTGLESGYSSSFTTKSDDYWIRLKYTKAGSKTIQATSGGETSTLVIAVTESPAPTTTKKVTAPKLYCVKDSNTSVKVTSVKVNEAFRCYTDAKAGIKLSASTTGLVSGYSSSFTTKSNDYWIRLKYNKAGSKSIYATDGSGQTGITITVK